MKKIIVICSALVLLAACSTTTKMYFGPDRPAGETAIIRPASSGVNIKSCDNQRFTTSEAIVLPGGHTIDVSFFDSLSNCYSRDSILMDFTAEAGHIYMVDILLNTGPGRYSAIIRDKTSGLSVARNLRSSATVESRLAFTEKSAREHPVSPIILTERGDALFQAGRYEEALRSFETALSFTPESNISHRELIQKRIDAAKERMR